MTARKPPSNNGEKRRTVRVLARVSPEVRQQLEQLAERWGLALSETVARLVTDAAPPAPASPMGRPEEAAFCHTCQAFAVLLQAPLRYHCPRCEASWSLCRSPLCVLRAEHPGPCKSPSGRPLAGRSI